jgi:hypothetical protein
VSEIPDRPTPPHETGGPSPADGSVPVGRAHGIYASTADTEAHILEVRRRLNAVIVNLHERALAHDASKLEDPEKPLFDVYTPLLANTKYGSPEYKRHLKGMGEALEHHYRVNDHHPEHHRHGIHDMDLIQLVEMLADWKAATLRHPDGDLAKSIEQNAGRFGYGQPMVKLLKRTATALGWL